MFVGINPCINLVALTYVTRVYHPNALRVIGLLQSIAAVIEVASVALNTLIQRF